MAFVNIWIHAVWGTKKHVSILVPEAKKQICKHIQQNATAKGFYIKEVNGHFNHLHCLMALRSDWSVAKQMQMIKGEATNWVNKNGILSCKLEWAMNISQHQLVKVNWMLFGIISEGRKNIIE